MHHARNFPRQELATGLAGQNIDLVPVFDCLASGQPEVGDGAGYIQIADTIYFCFWFEVFFSRHGRVL